jgi:hypothetical protein
MIYVIGNDNIKRDIELYYIYIPFFNTKIMSKLCLRCDAYITEGENCEECQSVLRMITRPNRRAYCSPITFGGIMLTLMLIGRVLLYLYVMF